MKKIANVSIDSGFKENFDSCVYMLKCYKNKKDLQQKSGDFLYYTDMTKNPAERLEEHLKNKDTYTKRFKGNIEVGYVELYKDLVAAQKRKEQLKKLRREEKKSLTNKKIAGVCDKCNEEMIKTVMIENDGTRQEILQCTGCKFWKTSPFKFWTPFRVLNLLLLIS